MQLLESLASCDIRSCASDSTMLTSRNSMRGLQCAQGAWQLSVTLVVVSDLIRTETEPVQPSEPWTLYVPGGKASRNEPSEAVRVEPIVLPC